MSEAGQTPWVELRNVSHRNETGETTLVDSISWRLHRGESWSVLGPNGAGKTLLLRMIAGKLWPNGGGEILREGKPLVNLRDLSRRVGWVQLRMINDIPAEEPSLDTVVSGKFGQLGLKPVPWDGPYDRPSQDDYGQGMEWLENLGCGHLYQRPFGLLSQGEQQKILLARALLIHPLAIILDEPCSGLDPGAREQFLATLQDLIPRVDTPVMILVTHHIEEIIPELSHVLVIHQGKLVRQGRRSEILTDESLGQIYGLPPRQVIQSNGRYWPIW